MGDAVAGLGGQISRIGEEMIEKEDKLSFAAAQTERLTADMAIRQELEKDPDWTTYEARYSEAMAKANESALRLVRSKADRQMFAESFSAELERGRAEVRRIAFAKETSEGVATLEEGLDKTFEVGQLALDEPTREAAVVNAATLIDGAVQRGYLSSEEAQKRREQWTSDYLSAHLNTLLTNEDVDGAQTFFKKYHSMIDWRSASAFEARIVGAHDAREEMQVAQGLVGPAPSPDGKSASFGDPLRGRGKGVTSSYGASRASGPHNGVDFAARVGTPIYPIGAGVVTQVSSNTRSGNFVVIDHGEGRVSSYSHMGSRGVKVGDLVDAGTQLGEVGMTGHTTGPHVHLVVRENGKTVDPQTLIGRAQQSPQRHDLNTLYAQVDALASARGWTPEKAERTKQAVDRLVSRDELLARRQEDEAMRSALDVVDRLGDNFTDTSQIPNYSRLSPQDRMSLEGRAKSNRVPKSVPANGENAVGLELMSIMEPDRFKGEDLRKYQHLMTPAEFASLAVTQAKLKTGIPNGDAVNLRERIGGTIAFWSKTDGYDLDPAKNSADFLNVFRDMEQTLSHVTGGKRAPTDAELKSAYTRATMNVSVPGWFGRNSIPRYQAKPGQEYQVPDMPANVRQRIIDTFKKVNGHDPTENQITQNYVANKGRPGFWQ